MTNQTVVYTRRAFRFWERPTKTPVYPDAPLSFDGPNVEYTVRHSIYFRGTTYIKILRRNWFGTGTDLWSLAEGQRKRLVGVPGMHVIVKNERV